MTDPLLAEGVALRSDDLIAVRRIALSMSSPASLAALPGGFATKRKGRGLEVADTREYAPGDDIRHLDRGTTARTGRLHVRQFQEERDRVTLLIADFRPSMYWGLQRAFRSVVAAEALSIIGWSLVEDGGRIGLLAILPQGYESVPARGRTRGMLGVIGGMVRAHGAGLAAVATGQTEERPLDTALVSAERLVPTGGEIVIASGFDTVGPGFSDRLIALSQRRSVKLVHVSEAEPEDLPAGQYPIRLPKGRVIRLGIGSSEARRPSARPDIDDIDGHNAVVVKASDGVEKTARKLVGSIALGRPA